MRESCDFTVVFGYMGFLNAKRPLGLFLVLLMAVVFLSNCKKWFVRECRKDASLIGGIILRELALGCYEKLNESPKTIAYTRQTQWDSQWARISTCTAPPIDFQTESVLLFYNSFGSGIKCIRKVERNPAHLEYVYT